MIKDNDKIYDVTKKYDLLNHTKVPIEKKYENTTLLVNTCHEKCNVLSMLLTPIKLKVYNCSHRHHRESKVHSGSTIKIIIFQTCFFVFYCALHWGPKSPVMQSYGIQKSIYGRFLFHFEIWEIFNLNLKFYF